MSAMYEYNSFYCDKRIIDSILTAKKIIYCICEYWEKVGFIFNWFRCVDFGSCIDDFVDNKVKLDMQNESFIVKDKCLKN